MNPVSLTENKNLAISDLAITQLQSSLVFFALPNLAIELFNNAFWFALKAKVEGLSLIRVEISQMVWLHVALHELIGHNTMDFLIGWRKIYAWITSRACFFPSRPEYSIGVLYYLRFIYIIIIKKIHPLKLFKHTLTQYMYNRVSKENFN